MDYIMKISINCTHQNLLTMNVAKSQATGTATIIMLLAGTRLGAVLTIMVAALIKESI
jgi:hypothetical protein